jgi:hypothetical protein
LQEAQIQIDSSGNGFGGKEIAYLHDRPAVSNLADPAVDYWPEEESSDALFDYVHTQRREDRLSD